MTNILSRKCTINSNNILGRYVVAQEDIQQGETILLETPVLIAPQYGEQQLCCLNCFRKSMTVCKYCKIFPLCANCVRHDNFDCKFFQDIENLPRNFLIENFSIYGPLKFLLLAENETLQFEYNKIIQMESHQDKRRNTEVWRLYNDSIVKPLLLSGILKYFKKTFVNEEIIQRICGIFDVNSFEVRGPDGNMLRGLYFNGSLLTHDCKPNTVTSVDENYKMKIYASISIAQGELVYTNYTNVLLGTNERKSQLMNGKYFICTCKRCKDTSELGTFLSSLTCRSCRLGLVMNLETHWQCNKCTVKMENSQVNEILNNINKEMIESNGDLHALEMLIRKSTPILNPNHYLIIDMKQNAAALLRTICMNSIYPPGRKVLERKIQLCREIIPILRILQPGISRLTAISLYEYFVPLLNVAKRERDSAEISETEYLKKIKECESILKESVNMLLHEQIKTPEGRLARKALFELKDLREEIKEIQKNLAMF